MPEVRLDETREEILHLRVSQCGWQRAFCAEARRGRMRAGVWVSLNVKRDA
jgi:hypothetical protein